MLWTAEPSFIEQHRPHCSRSSDTATGVLERAAEGLYSSGGTSAATTDDEPEFQDEEEDRGSSAGAASVEPSRSCSVTSEDEPLLDNCEYRKIRDLNRYHLAVERGLDCKYGPSSISAL